MSEKVDKVEKIKNLTVLYDKLLNHLESLTEYSKTIDDVKKNLDILKELNDEHVNTRNFARELLEYDFAKLAPNFLVAFMFKEINTQSILFINLVTKYNDELIQYVEEDNDESLTALIKEVADFNECAKKQFKPLRDKLDKMAK